MEDRRRTILAAVAKGELSPEEAARRIEELERAEARNRSDQDTAAQGEPAPGGAATVRRVRISRQMGPVTVMGDPGVREAVAEGPHVARREGDTLVIESHLVDDAYGFAFLRRRGRDQDHLLVRVNPAIELEGSMTAGPLRISGVTGPIRAQVTAGPLSIEGFAAPLDLSVQAGPVFASGRLDHGQSRIRCQAGPVRVQLRQGSSVHVQARATFGQVSLPRQRTGVSLPGSGEAVIGGGKAGLDIEVTMGAASVEYEG